MSHGTGNGTGSRLGLIADLTQSGIVWEESVNEELSKQSRPMGRPVLTDMASLSPLQAAPLP